MREKLTFGECMPLLSGGVSEPEESCHALRLERVLVLRASQFQLSSLELLTAARGIFSSNFQEHL